MLFTVSIEVHVFSTEFTERKHWNVSEVGKRKKALQSKKKGCGELHESFRQESYSPMDREHRQCSRLKDEFLAFSGRL